MANAESERRERLPPSLDEELHQPHRMGAASKAGTEATLTKLSGDHFQGFPTCSVIQSAPLLCPHLPTLSQPVPHKSWDESSWVCLWNSNLAFHSCVRSVPRGWHMFNSWLLRTCPVQHLSRIYSSCICICSPFSDRGVAVPAASNTAPSQATHSCGGVRRTHGPLPPPASMGPWVSQRKDQ